MTTSTEIAQKIDLGFDYVNLIGFSNEEELENEYEEEFYKKFVEVFADEWFTLIGHTAVHIFTRDGERMRKQGRQGFP